MQLIDRLEQLVSSGTRLPLSSRTIIDEQEFLDIIDQLRVTVPEEIKQARRMSQERERVIMQAEEEADKIINAARERASLMLSENELIRRAQEETQQIIAEARRQAEEIRQGADLYALDVLGNLENELTKLLATVRKGRATLDRSLHRTPENSGHPTE
ncbi:MAG TPA: ATPase [Chloroflexota bacterium]|nr:ATPase [Chloroflexota bacterium]